MSCSSHGATSSAVASSVLNAVPVGVPPYVLCLDDTVQDSSREPAPRGLLLVAAQLVRTGRTSLPELLGHLTPSDEQQATGQRTAKEALMKRVGDIGQINLGGSGTAGDSAGVLAGDQGEMRERGGGKGAQVSGQ